MSNEINNNPFDEFLEDFDTQDVINKPKTLSFEELVSDSNMNDPNSQEQYDDINPQPFFTQDDINELISSNSNDTNKSIQFEKYHLDSSLEGMVISAANAKGIKSFQSQEFLINQLKNNEKRSYESNLEVIYPPETGDFSDIDISEDNTSKYKPEEFFEDYIIAPKISGTKRDKNYNNLVPNEYIKNNADTVEINDSHHFDGLEHQNSVIEINRNQDGDIVSIIVYCKCGEKTVINFDYYDPVDKSSSKLTEIISDREPIQPLIDIEKNEIITEEQINKRYTLESED